MAVQYDEYGYNNYNNNRTELTSDYIMYSVVYVQIVDLYISTERTLII